MTTKFARSYLRRRTTERMTDACTIVRMGQGKVTYTRGTGVRTATNAAGVVIYDGPCRFSAIPGGAQTVLGDEELVVSQGMIALPWDAPVPEPEDQAKITESDDASLVGRYVKILNITRGGGLRASRQMMVQYLDTKKVSW